MPARLHRRNSRGAANQTGGLLIGLVNNMPDAAVRATERQFLGLLDTASGDIDVTLRFYSLPDIPRSDAARELFVGDYGTIDELAGAGIDGLIVTGTEPRTPELFEEPYWQSLTALIDWAQANTISTVWSCLAAHAAVLHLDGINRRPLGDKLSGVFECTKTGEHALVADAPSSWRVPHSRYNELPADELVARNYQPLACSPLAGVDSFVKECNSLFLFFQGHLEYDSQSLLREYLRDITRFIDGHRADYPGLPTGYLDPDSERAFGEVRETALARRNAKPMADSAASIAERRLVNFWRSPAANIYGSWLAYIQQQKLARALPNPRAHPRHGADPSITIKRRPSV